MEINIKLVNIFINNNLGKDEISISLVPYSIPWRDVRIKPQLLLCKANLLFIIFSISFSICLDLLPLRQRYQSCCSTNCNQNYFNNRLMVSTEQKPRWHNQRRWPRWWNWNVHRSLRMPIAYEYRFLSPSQSKRRQRQTGINFRWGRWTLILGFLRLISYSMPDKHN